MCSYWDVRYNTDEERVGGRDIGHTPTESESKHIVRFVHWAPFRGVKEKAQRGRG